MNKQDLQQQLRILKKKYCSAYARREILKLRYANRNQMMIQNKQLELAKLEMQIHELKESLKSFH